MCPHCVLTVFLSCLGATAAYHGLSRLVTRWWWRFITLPGMNRQATKFYRIQPNDGNELEPHNTLEG